jgi:glycine/D-amino acid oxidase-like deaminating enzyme
MKDLLIVGFGLAGLSAVEHAQELGLSFDILNDASQKSSRIAGGILNPVAIKRMKPVWSVEEFLPYAIHYYQKIEEKYGLNIFTKRAIKVFIQDNYKANLWFEALDNKRVSPFISSEIHQNTFSELKTLQTGLVEGYQVNLSHLFFSMTSYFKEMGCYKEQSFDHSEVNHLTDQVSYKGDSYKHIIFCEGFGIVKNPFFNDLGIYGNKGDYLIIEAKDLKTNQILKSKYFLIPIGNDKYKFGATYQRQPLDHIPSENAKAQMIEALTKMLDTPFKVIDQVCGIRPTTKDRKPILGTHHTYKNLHVFNGFASRGVMTSPLLGKQLLHFIFKGEPLPKDISINRFYART